MHPESAKRNLPVECPENPAVCHNLESFSRKTLKLHTNTIIQTREMTFEMMKLPELFDDLLLPWAVENVQKWNEITASFWFLWWQKPKCYLCQVELGEKFNLKYTLT